MIDTSIGPVCMPQRCLVQDLAEVSPMRQVSVQNPDEVVVVVAFFEMRKLMDDDVLQALNGFLGEFKI